VETPTSTLFFYLKAVKYTDLQSVLNFMYHREVNVAHEELNSFLDVAEDLRVKGLTQNQSGSHGFKKDLINQPQLSQSSQEPKEDPTVPLLTSQP
jgi:hypothetical protein